MSIERELLKRVISGDDDGDFFISHRLYKDIETFLDQPEQEPKFNFDLERMKAAIESPISNVTVDDLVKQVKQEPVAWKVIDGTNGNYMFSRIKPTERSYKYDVVIPLYTAPPVKSEQEPVGVVRTIGGYPDNSEHVVDWVCKYRDLKEGDRLYLAPQKREPLSEDKLDVLAEAKPLSEEAVGELLMDGFSTHLMDLVRMVEKAHGIGGGE